MGNSFPSWLTKQMIRGVRGFNLDAYLMALEGWRRGLTLTWYLDPTLETDLKIIGFYPLGKSFSLENGEKIHYFYRSRGDKVANKAVDISTNKQLTRERLIEAKVPTPRGETFNLNTTNFEEILKSARGLGFPLVAKPTFDSLGKGVTTNIKNESEVVDSINHIKNIGYDDVIIEEYFEGVDYRLYVVGDKVVGGTKRIPANVVGDGQHTIKQLIELKNKEREKNPYLSTRLINIDEGTVRNLHKQNLTLKSILSVNERLFLKDAANVSAGGDTIDVLEKLSPEIKNIAVKALNAIPGLHHAGIDILIRDGKCTVIEINSTADISMHIFPMTGESRNVPASIIDYYFPETKNLAIGNELIYFNYRGIRRLLLNNLVQSYKVMDAPKRLYKTRYIVTGKIGRARV